MWLEGNPHCFFRNCQKCCNRAYIVQKICRFVGILFRISFSERQHSVYVRYMLIAFIQLSVIYKHKNLAKFSMDFTDYKIGYISASQILSISRQIINLSMIYSLLQVKYLGQLFLLTFTLLAVLFIAEKYILKKRGIKTCAHLSAKT